MAEKVEWRISNSGADRYSFTKYIDGMAIDSYKPVSKDKATVFAVAIINGFEPGFKLKEDQDPRLKLQ